MAYSLLRRTGQFRIADTEKVKDMSSSPDQSTTSHIEATSTLRWQRRFLMALTVLAWIVTAGLIFWGIGLIIEPVILLVISALLAYLCYPVVQLFITGIVIFSLTVYFMIDGYRVNGWLRNKTPVKFRGRINLLMNVVEKSLGSFVRGQVLLAFIMSVIVGVGAYFIGVPYVFLLSVIVFVFEFVPVIGAYISGAIGILFALSVGWQTALIYGIFVTLMQGVLDGQILAPRIIGNSVGLHSIIAIVALLIGTRLFGLFGALFSAPVAGIIQVFVLAFWATWRDQHHA